MALRSLILVSLSLTLLAGPALPARCDDVVYYRQSSSNRLARISGQIQSYTAQKLQLRSNGGRTAALPSARIERIDSDWTPEQIQADQQLAAHQFRAALEPYGQAYQKEKRPWVRQRILAQIVWCYRSLGQFDRAGDVFAQLVREVPDTPYLEAIPLVWHSYQPSPSLERRAEVWVESKTLPAVALMGASWLLSGRSGPTASQTLQRLRTDPDPSIAVLARTQLWRRQVVTATAGDVAAWQATIHRMPEQLRAGPYFVLGKALTQHERIEEAAVALLRPPILYPRHRMLAAEGLVAAGQLLEQLARPDNARRLYQEVASQYGTTMVADLARQQLARLSKTDSE